MFPTISCHKKPVRTAFNHTKKSSLSLIGFLHPNGKFCSQTETTSKQKMITSFFCQKMKPAAASNTSYSKRPWLTHSCKKPCFGHFSKVCPKLPKEQNLALLFHYFFHHFEPFFHHHPTADQPQNSCSKKLHPLAFSKTSPKTYKGPNPALPKTQSKHHFELITIAFSYLQAALEQLVFLKAISITALVSLHFKHQ
jgi:hypothetical protein